MLFQLIIRLKALIYLLRHLYNFTSGRYDYFAKQLNANGFKVYGMDWIGKSTPF